MESRGRSSALWAATTACAAAIGLAACSGSDSAPPPLRELVLLAGTLDEGGSGRQDGVGTAARLFSPQGLALDAQGNLYVADTGNRLLRKITPAGVVSTVLDIDRLPASIDTDGHVTIYSGPTQVAFDPQGRLYVALNQTIWPRALATVAADPSLPGLLPSMPPLFSSWAVLRVAPDGSTQVVADPIHQAGGALPTGDSASALVFDAQGSLYVASAFECTIFQGDSAGQLTPFTHVQIRGAYCPGLNGVNFGVVAMALDSSGRLCLATVWGEVSCVMANGQQIVMGQTSSSPGYPNGMVFDLAGNLYLSARNNILKLSPLGDWVTLAGSAEIIGSEDGLGTAARFNIPGGLALDREGNLFVADRGNNTVRKISPDGRVSTVAGMARQDTRLVDAVGAAARFSANFTLAADSNGQIYVADFGHTVVRRIAPDGTVGTVAGAAGSGGHVDGIGSNARFWGPWSIAVGAGGNAIAGDGPYLRSISPAGEVRTLAFETGGGFVGAVAGVGNGTWLAVTRVVPIEPPLLPGSGGARPWNGHFAIKRLDQAGNATTLVDDSHSLLGGANAQGFAPAGIVSDDTGRIVFTLGHAVFEMSRQGELSLLAGQATES
ncbi:MAG: hypothetical protein WC681_16365, partial [Sterolibacterium sp.]